MRQRHSLVIALAVLATVLAASAAQGDDGGGHKRYVVGVSGMT